MTNNTCSSTISKSFSLLINGVLHVLILFAFLTILYFTLIAPLEKKAFENEIEDQVKKNVEKALDTLDKNTQTEIKKIITGNNVIDILISKYSSPSDVVIDHNKSVKFLSIILIVFLIIGLLTTIIILQFSCNKCTGINSIILENIITFDFIGIVEYLFFTKVAFKYVPSPPSTLVTSLFKGFSDNL